MPQTPPITQTPLEGLIDAHGTRESLISYLDMRIQSIESSLVTFRDKRQRYEQQMNDNFEWRSGGRARGSYSTAGDELVADIFDLQNDTLNIVGGFAAFMTARAVDDIFGTDPYYALSPEGMADDMLAQTMQKHSEWKLRKSDWKDAGLDSIDCAVGLGEAFLKSSWVTEIDIYETREKVLIDTAGKPVLTVDGDYIYEGDTALGQAVDPLTQQPTQVMTVAKDPTLALAVQGLAGFSAMDIEQTNVAYSNVRSAVMHFGDVLFEENTPSLEEGTFFGHRFQQRLSWIRSKYAIDATTLSILQTDTDAPKSAAAKPKDELEEVGEREAPRDIPDPNIELVECWIKYDPVGDGRIRRMFVLYARQARKIITMDYIANVTPEGALPVTIVRAFKVKNRCYGRGYFEIYDKAQEFIDRHLNYVALRNRYHSNPAIFMDTSLLLEDEESEEFQLAPGKTYRLKPGTKLEDFMQAFEYPDLDERTWQLMQMMIQVVQVRSGVTSAAQGEVSSMPSTATATGIESILQSASTLARMPMGLMKGGLEKSLLYAVKLIYANMNRDEIFTYFEGEAQKVGTLEATRIKDLDMNVRLLLTRFKQRDNIEQSEKAITLVTQQYLPLPEPEKGAVRPLFVQAVKAMGFDQADTIVRQPILMVDPTTGQPAGQQLASLPPPAQAPPPAQQQPERTAALPPPAAKAA